MNLLPPTSRQSLASSIRARFLITGAVIFGFAACVSILALLPAWFFAHAPQAELAARAEQSSTNPEISQASADRDSIQHTRTLLNELATLTLAKRSTSDTIAGVYVLRPPGVKVEDIVYSAGKVGTITISGTASNRDVINAYRASLSQSGRFDNVSVLVAALVGALEGRFTITLTGAF